MLIGGVNVLHIYHFHIWHDIMLGTTQNCVTHTALSPLAKGYKIRVLSSLCTAPTELIHGIALEALKDRDWIDVV